MSGLWLKLQFNIKHEFCNVDACALEADVGAVILFTVTVMDVLVGENSGSSKIIFRGNNSLSAIWPSML